MAKMSPGGEVYVHLMYSSAQETKAREEKGQEETMGIIPQTDLPRWLKIGRTTGAHGRMAAYYHTQKLAQPYIFYLPTADLPDHFEAVMLDFAKYVCEKDSQMHRYGHEWFYLDHNNPKAIQDSLVNCFYILGTLDVKEFMTCRDNFHDYMRAYDWREKLHPLMQSFDYAWLEDGYFKHDIFDCVIQHHLEKEEEYSTFNLALMKTEAAFSQHGINMVKKVIKQLYYKNKRHYKDFPEYEKETIAVCETEYSFDPDAVDGGILGEVMELIEWSESEDHYKFLTYLGGTMQTPSGVNVGRATQAFKQLKQITNAINNLRGWSMRMSSEYFSIFDDFYDYDDAVDNSPINTTIYDVFKKKDDKTRMHANGTVREGIWKKKEWTKWLTEPTEELHD
jgi:hypothetical protein